MREDSARPRPASLHREAVERLGVRCRARWRLGNGRRNGCGDSCGRRRAEGGSHLPRFRFSRLASRFTGGRPLGHQDSSRRLVSRAIGKTNRPSNKQRSAGDLGWRRGFCHEATGARATATYCTLTGRHGSRAFDDICRTAPHSRCFWQRSRTRVPSCSPKGTARLSASCYGSISQHATSGRL